MIGALTGLAFAILTALVVMVGDYALKLAADADMALTSRHVLAGCGLYVLSALMWFLALQHISLGQAAVAYSMFTLVGLCAIGVIYFGESLGLREVLGILCALMATALMFRWV